MSRVRCGMMAGMPGEYRLYQELADWWPLISPPGEYAAEAAYLAGLFDAAPIEVREVLDLGSGGGHVAVHLKDRLDLTLVDLSAGMLAVSRRLNPECAHQQGDMRTIRLGRMFDAVLVHDAVDYVTDAGDLRELIATAFAHCRPGGMALFVPDYTAETFEGGTGGGGSTDADGRQGSFREWTWDPDPADEWIQVEYEFTLRAADGTVQIVREAHRLGAFRRETWLRLLADAGFEPEARLASESQAGSGTGAGMPAHLFIGWRPHRAAGQPGADPGDMRRSETRAG
jgi:SAM-dependent methyltransferase